MAPIKEAQKFMKENYPGKVGKLTRNTGSSSGYSISGREYKDAAPAEVRDASDRDRRALESIKSIVNNIQRSSDVLHDFIVIKNTANQIQDKTLKAEAMKIVNSMASKIRRAGAHDALSKAIRTADAENERWITMNGSHVKIDGEGNAVAGNEKVKSIINSKKKSETAGKSEKKQAEGSKKETYKSYSDFKKNSGAEDLLQFVDEVAFDAGHDERDPDKEDLKRIGKEFKDVYEKIKDHPNVGEYVNKMRREINDKIEDEIGTTLYDYSYLGIKELRDTLEIFNKYYD